MLCIILIQDITQAQYFKFNWFKIDGDADTIYFLDDDDQAMLDDIVYQVLQEHMLTIHKVQLIIQQVQLQLIL